MCVQAQEVVQRENEVDGTAGEQTWPTEEELMQAGPVGRARKRFPEGTSDYQAAWLDPDDSSSSEDDEEGGACLIRVLCVLDTHTYKSKNPGFNAAW